MDNNPTILAVIGSRTITNYDQVEPHLEPYLSKPNLQFISGGATGPDTFAKQFADKHNIIITELKPDWKTYKKSAGFRRNVDIISKATEVIAFWDGTSKGTKHSIDLATQQKKPCNIIML